MTAQFIGAGAFEPARNVSEFNNNKETSSDPRVGTTPPTYPLDGTRDGELCRIPALRRGQVRRQHLLRRLGHRGQRQVHRRRQPQDRGAAHSTSTTPAREDYGDHYLKIPWVIGGENSNLGVGETVWRYDYLAKGEPEEQGECQLRATSDGSKMYAICHSMIPGEEDPDAELTRWYPWKPEESYENDLWFRRVIFWPDAPE